MTADVLITNEAQVALGNTNDWNGMIISNINNLINFHNFQNKYSNIFYKTKYY